MDNKVIERDCKHGSLSRSCQLCELEAESARLSAHMEELRAAHTKRMDALKAENAKLREAMKDAATSLETIGRLAGKAAYLGDDGERIPTCMEFHDEVRGYANSRASVARAALGEK